MRIERSLLWAGAATTTALILVALSLSLTWYHISFLGDELEYTYYQRTSGIEGFSAVQTWLTYGWIFFGWLLLMSLFVNARTPSILLSWVLFALAVTTFAHFTAYIGAEVSDLIQPPWRDFDGRLGSGWFTLLMATVLQVLGSAVLMAKGFSMDRKEADMEPPTVG